MFYQIAVNSPLKTILTYKGDEGYALGQLVEVPFGRRKSLGCILEKTEREPETEFQIKSILGEGPYPFHLSEFDRSFLQWIANYYHYSFGQLIFDILPKALKRPREVKWEEGSDFIPYPTPTSGQNKILAAIRDQGLQKFHKHLVHGVTGSGKTLIYLHLIEETLKAGKSAQFLLPEINLTPQFIRTFTDHLSCKVLPYHSGLNASERFQVWRELSSLSEPVLILGVRSSIFLPVENLGLIVVDEEHDQSFKQSDRCPYNGRDVAIKKAQMKNIPIIMGSATPSVENYYAHKYGGESASYHTLFQRVGDGYFPEIKVLDARDRFTEDDPCWPLLPESIDVIKEALGRREQVLVFINKLGFARYLQCRACGYQFVNEKCGCDLPLRYFKQKERLDCSYCEYKTPAPKECPSCQCLSLRNMGFGTEKVTEVLREVLPERKIERFDRDEIKSFKDLSSTLDKFHSGDTDILVGTQMLSKGHNFEKVNTVLILGLDGQLNFSDFRSLERGYQMILQVSGRAGRYSPKSQVVIQSMNPEHGLFSLLDPAKPEDFYEKELEIRHICECSPFGKMTMIYFHGKNRARLIRDAENQAHLFQRQLLKHKIPVNIFGPKPSFIEKRSNLYTWCLLIKADDFAPLHQAIKLWEQIGENFKYGEQKLDIDPYQTM